MGATKSTLSKTHNENLETFSLVWLDAQINTTEDNLTAQQKLRQVINHLKTFDDPNKCQKYILSLSPQDRLVLIVSGQCGRQLVPQIHHLRQISSIYVYCFNKQANEQWARDFTKVKSVIVQLDDLINKIKQDQNSHMRIEEPLAINIFMVSDNSDLSTTGLNGHFVHSLLLIDVLLRTKSNETNKQQLIIPCKNQYENNDTQLAIVREFECEYSADKILWWYTRESFLYRMLNKALRMQNIDVLFLFRFVIGDIYRQLMQNQCRTPVRVYRGQVMSNDEINLLQRSIDDFNSINSFFSTTPDRARAFRFLKNSDASNNLQRVLFDIDADPRVVKSKPFADVTLFSDFVNEHEILFMVGCVFRLIEIRQNHDEKIWVIKMKLCSDDEHDLKTLFDYMKTEYGGGENEVNLRSFGDVLHLMGKYDLAEKMYRRSLDEVPSNDPSLGQLYYSLGTVTKDKGEYDASLHWFDKSLEMEMQTDLSNYASISGTFTSIGAVHWMKGDSKTALEYYKRAIILFKHAQDDNHPDMAHLYNNIAIIYADKKKYSQALDYYRKSLDIREKHLPSDHPDVAGSYNNMGLVHLQLGQHDLAMQYYEQSLKIRMKSLPSQHPDIAASYKNIGGVYETKKEWKQALGYYQKAATIYRHSLPGQHPDVIKIENDIKGVSLK